MQHRLCQHESPTRGSCCSDASGRRCVAETLDAVLILPHILTPPFSVYHPETVQVCSLNKPHIYHSSHLALFKCIINVLINKT